MSVAVETEAASPRDVEVPLPGGPRLAVRLTDGPLRPFLLVHGLSRIATMSGMPSSAPVILSYAVYGLLLVAAVLFLPGGLVSVLASFRVRARERERAASAKTRAGRSAPSNPEKVVNERHEGLL